jgi:hypothetical protein
MPDFELNANYRGSHPFYALPDFAKGYVEAMFFTNGDTGDEREWRLNDLGVERLTRAAVKDIKADCNAFLGHIMPDGCFVRQWLNRFADDYDDAQAGRDFWFTRQGHGVGYWDRKQLPDAVGKDLSAAARSFGEAYVEEYRAWIYHR